MASLRGGFAFILLVGSAAGGGCTGQVAGHGGTTGGAGGTAGVGADGGGAGGAGAGGAVVPSDDPLLPARVRRLTNVEYQASVRALFGGDTPVSLTSFPPDSRQKLGFTVNDAQIVSSVLAGQLDAAAQAVVATARGNGRLANVSPCNDPTHAAAAETCAGTFIRTFGQRAYRRPLDADESDALLALYRIGADGGAYADGIDLVTRAVLQSPGFLYATEIGAAAAAAGSPPTVSLTPAEIASALSFAITAGPPDQPLVDAMAGLGAPAAREQQVRRLLAAPAARDRLVRVVREWIGIDRVDEQGKDDTAYPTFAATRSAMSAETTGFITEVLQNGAGTVAELLGAEWTAIGANAGASSQEIDDYYRQYYGLPAGGAGRVMLTGASGGARVGILNQGAFLSTFATATDSHPVLRGVAVMRRVACLEIPDPVELNINVVPPVPDPDHPKANRDLFTVHATDQVCATCHGIIDSFGFAFEHYDGMGAYRERQTLRTGTSTVDLPIDSATVVTGTGSDLDGRYADGNELARALAASDSVRGCMARQIFRASVGRSDASVRGAEEAFVTLWRGLPADKQGNIVETIVAWAKSPGFVERRTAP